MISRRLRRAWPRGAADRNGTSLPPTLGGVRAVRGGPGNIGPSALPDVVMAPRAGERCSTHAGDRLAPRSPRPISVVGVLFGGLGGAILLVLGVVLAWFVFATPILHGFTVRPARRSGDGDRRLRLDRGDRPARRPRHRRLRRARRDDRAAGPVPRPPRAATGLGRVLGAEYVVATDVILPDGAVIPEIVVGPHGAAVIETRRRR